MASNPSSSTAKLGGRAAWIALILVSLTQAMSMVDRQVLSILAPRILVDLQITGAELGLLYGTVFALFYAVFSLPLGRLADGWVRTKLLSLSILAWSASTALGGFANSFTMLAMSRLGVGIGEASSQPAGLSLLADSFPREKRGMISSWMAAATTLGIGGALLIGGLTADAWDHAWPAGGAPLGLKAWQAAFLIASLPGLLLAFFLWRLPEPDRGAADNVTTAARVRPFHDALTTLYAILPITCWLNLARRRASAATWFANVVGLALIVVAMTLLTRWTEGISPDLRPLRIGGIALTRHALQWLIIGLGCYVLLNWLQSLKLTDRPSYVVILRSPAVLMMLGIGALQGVVNYGVMFWIPTYLNLHFGQSSTGVALQFGLISAVLGMLGSMLAGPLADRLRRRWPAGRLYVTLAALGISPFFGFLTFRAADLTGFYLWFVPYSIILTMWLPSVYATFLDLVLPRMRGTVISVYILTQTILGLGLGPYAVGLISDVNGHDYSSAILNVYWVGVPLVILIILAIRRLPKDEALIIERAREAGEPI